MANVREVTTLKTVVNQEVVDRLRHVLEQAERGELVGVAIAYTYQDGAIGTTFSAAIHHGALLGAIATLQYRYAALHNKD